MVVVRRTVAFIFSLTGQSHESLWNANSVIAAQFEEQVEVDVALSPHLDVSFLAPRAAEAGLLVAKPRSPHCCLFRLVLDLVG